MRGRTRATLAAGLTSLALVATACGGGGTTPPANEGGGQTGGEITVAGCTPENPLVPGNTAEVCGGDIVDAMTSKLIEYNTETAAPENDIAESIETSDNKFFTVKLKPYKFQDGTEVKAKNFVDAWNYTAYGPNGQEGSGFYAPMAGSPTCSAADEKCAKPPKAKTMSGLKVVDDKTFTITTSEPVSNLPVRLGYSAYSPLPDVFFADPKAFEKKPIGAGPVQGRLDQQHRDRAVEVRRVLRREQAQRRQADLPDLPGPRCGLRRRGGRQPGLHRRQQHPTGPARRRGVQERLPGPDLAEGFVGQRLDHVLAQ